MTALMSPCSKLDFSGRKKEEGRVRLTLQVQGSELHPLICSESTGHTFINMTTTTC